MRERVVSVTAADMVWMYFRGTGPGGQKRNKTSNCVRCFHEPSGSVGEARESRSQRENREAAFRKCVQTPTFQRWIKLETARRVGTLMQIEEEVERQMTKVRVDRKDERGLWEEWDE